jgi:hypothetical protein
MKLKESLDNVLDYIVTDEAEEFVEYTFYLIKEFNLNLRIVVTIDIDIMSNTIIVSFNSHGPDNNLSTEKKASFAIFATLTEIIDEVVNNNDIENIEASGDSLKKAQIYEKLFKRFSENWEVDRLRLNVYAQKKD